MDWPMVNLSEVVTIDRNSVTPDNIASGTRYVGLENMNSDGEFQDIQIVKNGELKSNKFQFDSQHILYGKLRPYLRKISRPDFSGICSTDILPIRCGPEMDRNFVYHYLRKQEMVDMATSRCSGANLPRLSPKILLTFQISKPPLAEQKRIAAILDKTDVIEQSTTSAHSMKQQLIHSTFLDLFGDPHLNPNKFEEMTLRDVSTHYTDGPFGSNLKSSHYTVEGPRVIRLGDIDIGEINDDNISHISAEHYQSLERHHLCEGDVVVATLGNPMLRSAIVARSALPAINKSDVVLIRPNTDIVLAEYISCLFNSTLEGGYWSNLVHGQTRGRISGGQLSKVVIPVPPLDLQQIFVARMKSIAQFVTGLELAKSSSSSLVESITQEMLS